MIGIKWQMDVKYVPKEYYVGNDGEKFYQYTVIDEASRERFIFLIKNIHLIQLLTLLKELLFILGINLK